MLLFLFALPFINGQHQHLTCLKRACFFILKHEQKVYQLCRHFSSHLLQISWVSGLLSSSTFAFTAMVKLPPVPLQTAIQHQRRAFSMGQTYVSALSRFIIRLQSKRYLLVLEFHLFQYWELLPPLCCFCYCCSIIQFIPH